MSDVVTLPVIRIERHAEGIVGDLREQAAELRKQLAAMERERDWWKAATSVACCAHQRQRDWIFRIEGINDNPGDFNADIADACQSALQGLRLS